MHSPVIDCHGHYTTSPPQLAAFRPQQVDALHDPSRSAPAGLLHISDDEIRESVESAQIRLQRERGTDITLFSPRAAGMGHHVGDAVTSDRWSVQCNDLVHRVCALYPQRFAGVCQLPQSPGVAPATCVAELTRCVSELGFVGCNLNPDPTGGYWTDLPITDLPHSEAWAAISKSMPMRIRCAKRCSRWRYTTASRRCRKRPAWGPSPTSPGSLAMRWLDAFVVAG